GGLARTPAWYSCTISSYVGFQLAIDSETNRTDPSAKQNCAPPGCRLVAPKDGAYQATAGSDMVRWPLTPQFVVKIVSASPPDDHRLAHLYPLTTCRLRSPNRNVALSPSVTSTSRVRLSQYIVPSLCGAAGVPSKYRPSVKFKRPGHA